MFELFDEWDWLKFLSWTIVTLVIGGITGYAISQSLEHEGVVVAAGAPSAHELLVPENCAECLPRCFHVYNKTREFGMTVRAVEEGWIR